MVYVLCLTVVYSVYFIRFRLLDFTKTFLLHIIGCHGRDSMVAGFTPKYTISVLIIFLFCVLL
jgi:hypothetical protein